MSLISGNTLKRQRGRTPLSFGNNAYGSGGLPSQWYTNRGLSYTRAETATGYANNSLIVAPIHIMAGTRVDRMAVKSISGTGSGKATLGIYANNGLTGMPEDLLIQFGTQVTEGAGVQEITIDFTFHHTDIYWLALLIDTEDFSLLADSGGGFNSATTGSTMGIAYSKSYASPPGALPTTFPTTFINTVTQPRIMLRLLEVPSYTTEVDRIKSLTRVYGFSGLKMLFGTKTTYASQSKVHEANDLALVPFVAQTPMKLESVDVNVGTAAPANSKGDILIYDSRPDNRPNKIMAKGEVAIDSTGSKTLTVGFEFASGLYWMGFHNRGSGNVTLASHEADGDLQFAVAATNYPSLGRKINTASAPNPFTGTPVDWLPAPRFTGKWTASHSGNPHQTHLRRMYGPFASVGVPGWYIGTNVIPYTTNLAKILHGYGQARATPIFVDKPLNFDQVGISQSDAAAGIFYKMYIYEDTGGFHPGRMLHFLGTITTGAQAGDQTASITLHLDPGLYWLADYVEANVNVHDMTHWSGATTHATRLTSPAFGYLGFNSDPWPTGAADGDIQQTNMWLRVKDHGGW